MTLAIHPSTALQGATERLVSTVDVIIPVYNCADTVADAVASIQAQTVRDIRIIVINDGSSDATRQIVERLAAADDRLVLINQENSGIVDALNAGLAACTVDIVARHDGDDLALPDRFERQLAYLRDNPDCVAVAGAIQQIDGAGRTIGPVLTFPSPDLADPGSYPQREPYLMHPFLMVRRASVEEVGGYRHVFHAEDTDLYWRLQETGKLSNMPDLLGSYRVHAQGITSSSLVNGRIAALNSQLAGISAMRRRSGRPDIAFPKSAFAEYQKARSLEAIIRLGGRELDSEEVERLTIAVCAKLLQTASYRVYEIDGEDCTFINATLSKELSKMAPLSRDDCIRMLSGTAARLVSTGKLSVARRLVPLRLYPLVAARLALRTVFPPMFRRLIRQAAGRSGYVK